MRPGLLERFIELVYTVGAVCSGVLMIALFSAAFCEIASAVLTFFRKFPNQLPGLSLESELITAALKGIELLFLAPMTFLVYRSLANYIACKTTGRENPEAEAAVTESKALVTSLMAAVVATDLVGKVLSPDGFASHPPIYELLLIIVLVGYFYLLSKMSLGKSSRPMEAVHSQQHL
jgi:hypothetical protein